MSILCVLKTFAEKEVVKKIALTAALGAATQAGMESMHDVKMALKSKRRKKKVVSNKVIRPEFKRTGLPESYEYYVTN